MFPTVVITGTGLRPPPAVAGGGHAALRAGCQSELCSTLLSAHALQYGLRTPRESFFQKSQTFKLGQTFWAEMF